MLELTRPLYLLLALAVPPLVWWWLRRRREALLYPSTGLFLSVPSRRSRLARWVGAATRAAALLLLVVALAGPRWPDLRTRIPTEGIAIEMLVDVSGSMAEPDFNWAGQPISRLEAVRKVFHLFVEGGQGPGGQRLTGRPDDLVGLVTFATWPESPCPLTLSHAVLLQLLDEQRPRTVPTASRTNIGDAVVWGLRRLGSARDQRKVMVLLSDGEHNVRPPALTPRQAAQLAANERIPIYTIDAGGDTDPEEGALPGETEGAAVTPGLLRAHGERTLKAVAEITGGRYFRARDSEQLLAVCQEIDRLERRPIESPLYRRYHEGFVWFGLASFVLLTGIYVLEMTVWRRLP